MAIPIDAESDLKNGDRELEASQLQTIPEWLIARAEAMPHATAYVQPGPSEPVGWTWQAVIAGVAHYAHQLRARGTRAGDRCVTIGENRIEWILLDLAIQSLGAVHVPLQPVLSGKHLAELIAHCEPQCVVALTQAALGKLPTAAHARERLIAVQENDLDVPVLEPFRAVPTPPCAVAEWKDRLAAGTDADQVTTLLYTSGTTGRPKGVMLSHRNLVSNMIAKLATLPLGPDDVRLAWLPWTHIFGRLCDLYTGIAAGCETVISRGREDLFDELRAFRPTYLNGVPYFYEKCYRLLESRGELDRAGALSALLGGRMKLCNCGGAPLALHVFDYFRAAGIELICGYGLTETSPVLTSNRPAAWRRGTVGQAVPGVQLRVADDGEILARGPNVMLGYFRDPQQTAAVMADGWFHTGDLGEMDAEGYLTLRGRKKDLIVLNTGLKVAPSLLEHLIANDPLISQCVVVGDRRNYLAALVTLDPDEQRRRWPILNFEESATDVVTESEVRRAVAQILASVLADRPPHEQIGAWAIIRRPFGFDDELVTAKHSLRREAIAARYQSVIEALYSECLHGSTAR